MNPYGAGRVVVVDGRVTDDGDFYTQNGQPVPLRWVVIYHGGAPVFGWEPPRRATKSQPRPPFLMTRAALADVPLHSIAPAGESFIRLWGGVDSDPDWYEIGSGNPQDNGATDVVIGTQFTIGPPPPDPVALLRRGVTTLIRSNAYQAGFANVVAGTNDCNRALDLLGAP